MERTGTGSVIGARVGTTLARLVGSVSAAVITRVPTTERIIYLTIDDGPSENTLPLLDALDAEDVQATWFVAGENVARNPDTVREVLSRGHRVGLHGYRHLDAWRNRWELVRSDMEASRSQLNRIAGYESYMVRPPFGRLRPALLKWCRRRGDRCPLGCSGTRFF